MEKVHGCPRIVILPMSSNEHCDGSICEPTATTPHLLGSFLFLLVPLPGFFFGREMIGIWKFVLFKVVLAGSPRSTFHSKLMNCTQDLTAKPTTVRSNLATIIRTRS